MSTLEELTIDRIALLNDHFPPFSGPGTPESAGSFQTATCLMSPLARLALGEEAELGPSGCDKPPL